MTMTETAKNIAETVADLARTGIVFGTSGYAMPDHFKLRDIEPLEETPRRFRGTFRTSSLGAFEQYLSLWNAKEQDADCPINATMFVDDKTDNALAILTFGTLRVPMWQDCQAVLTPKYTPLYQALMKIGGGILSQRAAASFVDDWGFALQFARPDGSFAPWELVRQEIADLTVEKVRTVRSQEAAFNRALSSAEKLAIGPQGTGSAFPTKMVVECCPYDGLQPRRIEYRIEGHDTNGMPGISISQIGLAALSESLSNEFLALCEQIGERTGVRVLRGTFDANTPKEWAP